MIGGVWDCGRVYLGEIAEWRVGNVKSMGRGRWATGRFWQDDEVRTERDGVARLAGTRMKSEGVRGGDWQRRWGEEMEG